jgi:hypothetical protein
MGKIEAISFLRAGGKKAVITSAEKMTPPSTERAGPR